MAITSTEIFQVRNELDIVLARQAVRRLSQAIGFGLVDQTKIVTAASELARNVVVYGLGGTMTCETMYEAGRNGLRLNFVDHGPGIENVEQAMTDGWTSGTGMGLGLSGAKRLVNEFEIETAPGKGTRVMVARWK
jgi:serine/threonine-protein kinase RsbT